MHTTQLLLNVGCSTVKIHLDSSDFITSKTYDCYELFKILNIRTPVQLANSWQF